jgi:hypothetical protein
MRRFVSTLAIATTLLAPALYAQNTIEQAQSAPSQLCPSTPTLEDLSKALDDAVSGPADKDRACLRELLLPDAHLTPIRKTPDGSFTPHVLTVDDWINAVSKGGRTAMYERQVKVTIETYGHFAHLWSTYEIRDTPDGPATVTGINSIQAINDGKQWKVFNILWEPDTTAGPLPEKYKP